MFLQPRRQPGLWALVALGSLCQPAWCQKKPNILVIFGDDIGVPQISAYTMGMMGYKTPNIDRIAKEGAIFTDAYAQNSCTAGRASVSYTHLTLPTSDLV